MECYRRNLIKYPTIYITLLANVVMIRFKQLEKKDGMENEWVERIGK